MTHTPIPVETAGEVFQDSLDLNVVVPRLAAPLVVADSDDPQSTSDFYTLLNSTRQVYSLNRMTVLASRSFDKTLIVIDRLLPIFFYNS